MTHIKIYKNGLFGLKILFLTLLLFTYSMKSYGLESITETTASGANTLFVGLFGNANRSGPTTGLGTGAQAGFFFIPYLGGGVTFQYTDFSSFKQYSFYTEGIVRLPRQYIQPSLSWVFGHNWLNTEGRVISRAQDISGWVTGPAANVDFKLGGLPLSLGLRLSYLVTLENNAGYDQASLFVLLKGWL